MTIFYITEHDYSIQVLIKKNQVAISSALMLIQIYAYSKDYKIKDWWYLQHKASRVISDAPHDIQPSRCSCYKNLFL